MSENTTVAAGTIRRNIVPEQGLAYKQPLLPITQVLLVFVGGMHTIFGLRV